MINIRDITPKFENKEIDFNCIVLGTGDRKSYVRNGWIECPSCHDKQSIKCDEYRRLFLPKCNRRTCHGVTKQLDPAKIETGYIQTITIQEPVEEILNNSPVILI